MFFRSTASPKVRSKAPKGLPALPPVDSEVALRARRTMDKLIAKQQYSKQIDNELVLPELSEANKILLAMAEPSRAAPPPVAKVQVETLRAAPIPSALVAGLDVVGSVLGAFSADELDELLQECQPNEREVLLASLVMRLRNNS